MGLDWIGCDEWGILGSVDQQNPGSVTRSAEHNGDPQKCAACGKSQRQHRKLNLLQAVVMFYNEKL